MTTAALSQVYTFKTLQGRQWQLDANPNELVADVKARLETLGVGGVAAQRLIGGGKIWEDSKLFGEYEHDPKTPIFIVINQAQGVAKIAPPKPVAGAVAGSGGASAQWCCPACTASNLSNREKCFVCDSRQPVWTCGMCDYQNNLSQKLCLMCSSPAPGSATATASTGAITTTQPLPIVCQACTYPNDKPTVRCAMCDTPLPGVTQSPAPAVVDMKQFEAQAAELVALRKAVLELTTDRDRTINNTKLVRAKLLDELEVERKKVAQLEAKIKSLIAAASAAANANANAAVEEMVLAPGGIRSGAAVAASPVVGGKQPEPVASASDGPPPQSDA